MPFYCLLLVCLLVANSEVRWSIKSNNRLSRNLLTISGDGPYLFWGIMVFLFRLEQALERLGKIIFRLNSHKSGSPGLVVVGDDPCSIGHGFESQHQILDGHDIFSH